MHDAHLSAALVVVEVHEAGDTLDDIGLFVHDDDGGRAQRCLVGHKVVKVHHYGVTHPEKLANYHHLICLFHKKFFSYLSFPGNVWGHVCEN